MKQNSNASGSSSAPVVCLPLDNVVRMWTYGVKDEDRCPCGAILKEPEKHVGLCRKCQEDALRPEEDYHLFSPTYQLTSLPTMTFAPMAMAHKLCPHPECRWAIRKGICSNPKCPLKRKKK